MTAVATEVKERPILFSGPMVRAILEGHKCMTRRVVKPQPFEHKADENHMGGWYEWGWKYGAPKSTSPKSSFWHAATWHEKAGTAPIDEYCPFGQPGDRLWVRETWQSMSEEIDLDYRDDDGVRRTLITYKATPRVGIRVPGVIHPVDKMTYLHETTELDHHYFGWPIKWKPSIFMPRWASRITLEVTGVRVERLQDISEEDAIAEGMYTNGEALKKLGLPADTKLTGSVVDKFRIVWESINGKTYPWESNCWVWVVEFRRITNAS